MALTPETYAFKFPACDPLLYRPSKFASEVFVPASQGKALPDLFPGNFLLVGLWDAAAWMKYFNLEAPEPWAVRVCDAGGRSMTLYLAGQEEAQELFELLGTMTLAPEEDLGPFGFVDDWAILDKAEGSE